MLVVSLTSCCLMTFFQGLSVNTRPVYIFSKNQEVFIVKIFRQCFYLKLFYNNTSSSLHY